jgi:hypothetical protein
VTIAYAGGQQWPTDYIIDWAKVTNLQGVVQVVDGLWTFDANGVRPAAMGYDRVLALGDIAWDSYEAVLTIGIHDLSNIPTDGAIWLGMQWGGHTDNPFGGQPHGGYILYPGRHLHVQRRRHPAPVRVLRQRGQSPRRPGVADH